MSDRLAAAVLELVDALREELTAANGSARNTSAPEQLLSVDAAASALSIGRTLVYSEIQAGRLRSVKVGRRRLIPATALIEYLRLVA